MHQLSHVLADEIYNRVEARDQLAAAWQEEKEEKDAVEILINEFADLKEYGSSEENSNEENEEEEEYLNDYEDMGDYDYLADVNGEYDELAMELEADVNDRDDDSRKADDVNDHDTEDY